MHKPLPQSRPKNVSLLLARLLAKHNHYPCIAWLERPDNSKLDVAFFETKGYLRTLWLQGE